MKFLAGLLCGVRRCRRADKRKRRIRELLPDSKIFRRNCEPPEREHVSARFGHAPRLLRYDLIDDQSFSPLKPATGIGGGAGIPGLLSALSALPLARIFNSKASSCRANVASASLRLFNSSARASSRRSPVSVACGSVRVMSIDGARQDPPAGTGGEIHTTLFTNTGRWHPFCVCGGICVSSPNLLE